MNPSRTTVVLFAVLAVVIGLAVFAPSESVEPVASEAVERSSRGAAPVTTSAAPVLASAMATATADPASARRGAEASRATDAPRFAARAGETLFGAPRRPPPPPKPVAPPPPPPPPAPVADPVPAVPFVVVGLMEPRGGHPTAWLAEGNRLHVAVAGDVIDNRWRIDTIDRKSVRLTFLPRTTQHALPVPSETSR